VAFGHSRQLVALMSLVGGLFHAFFTLASESDFTTPKLIFYADIDDHGIHWGDTGQILA
jgi:hypothetical protein